MIQQQYVYTYLVSARTQVHINESFAYFDFALAAETWRETREGGLSELQGNKVELPSFSHPS